MIMIRFFSVAALLAVLTACAGQQQPAQAAASTSAVVNSARTQLERFADTRDRIANIEARRLASFEAQLISSEEQIKVELGAMQLARHPGVKLYASLSSYAEAVAAASRQADVIELSNELLSQRTPLKTPSSDMKRIAAQLAELGESDSLSERIQFLIEFAQSVSAAVDAAQTAKHEAIEAAAAAN